MRYFGELRGGAAQYFGKGHMRGGGGVTKTILEFST